MEKQMYYIIIAIILAAMIPLMPKIIRIRIAILRWLRFKRIADWNERHFSRLVPIVRILFVPVIIYLLYLGFRG